MDLITLIFIFIIDLIVFVHSKKAKQSNIFVVPL